jgi:transcriptional regulator with XRE-family HTH domain
MDMSDVIRSRRRKLGLSQAELAKAAGVSVRQMARYEAGEQQPVLSVAVDLADALGIPVAHLAGRMPRGIDLTGDWWAGWQTFRDGTEHLAIQPVHLAQDDEVLEVAATAHGLTEEEGGGYLWRGELRLWDNALLMGWYAAADGGVRAKGTMYFVLSPHGLPALGRWVGLSHDGRIITGWAAIAKGKDKVHELITALKDSDGQGPPL